jgi:hypothetical protein
MISLLEDDQGVAAFVYGLWGLLAGEVLTIGLLEIGTLFQPSSVCCLLVAASMRILAIALKHSLSSALFYPLS